MYFGRFTGDLTAGGDEASYDTVDFVVDISEVSRFCLDRKIPFWDFLSDSFAD